MSGLSVLEVQKAIYAELNGDVSLGALVSGVFDRVREGTQFPYVVLGEAEAQHWQTVSHSGQEVSALVHVFSREGGRKECMEIMEQVYALLHEAELVLSGFSLIFMRFDGSDLELERDGLTYHGRMQFRLLVQAES
ncbi:MAG: hypothetical protein CMM94_06360 [Rickettsiales bacterium]|nr:hypothetical protein [Rickettsiales bacterium]|tara:strand:+ start:228 stop:635 length:408 start_codon:yes stop_codon:yes gene_type:complete